MDSEFSDGEGFGIEVIIDAKDGKAPCCPHGPTLLFEKLCGGGETQGRRFYACSACRDRKDCSFFQWEDEKVSQARLLAREKENQSKQPPYSHQEYCSRFREFVSLPLDQRRFCQDCQLLLLPNEWSEHATHRALGDDITVARLRRPSLLLCPLENKKSNAQYLFADRSCHFLLDLLASLGFSKVLCVGTPRSSSVHLTSRLHELMKIRNQETGKEVLRSLLLDIDFRYAQFYSQKEFCHYNMFNHHFFNPEGAEAVFKAFLSEEGPEKVVMVTDPPFGGLVKPLAHSFSRISNTWKTLQGPESSSKEMPIVWIFPYFFESRILECFPSFSMLDYQVDYDNHPLYKHGKTGRRQSPVRLFTNLCPRNVVLPESEGYRFCSVCERYVSSGNRHCPVCDACTSKDGREWRHCAPCNKCVKPSWLHCSACGRCALPDHPCGRGQTGCFTCSSLGHKRRACPHSGKLRENRGQAAGRRPGANLSKQIASRVAVRKGKPSRTSKAHKVT
ncbi:rRNA N6-adenosine-methyltransferase ZCCHC4 isoform X3 [Anguilla anguilla]|uniref:rRNA N6-adenosine-methyltransferase ZCCHC4 isoform X3 n=1 Tax=Anguilla anguilla TaxID=7936 RepID=UPI0015B13CD5|nr:rRNA N6-adenosine-methyltransferase ZCCHC4 isoform X3 [Anguilla anguilla]